MMEGDTAPDLPEVKLGERLTRARRDRGMSVEDVAHALRLSARHISALEDERFDDLHGPTYIRGYLRNYARLVGLPVDEILAAYGQDAKSETVVRPIAQPVQRQVRSSDRRMRLVTYLIVAVLAVLVAVWWRGQSGEGPLLRGIVTTPSSERPAPSAAPGTTSSELDNGAAIETGAEPEAEAAPEAPDVRSTLPTEPSPAVPAEEPGDGAATEQADQVAAAEPDDAASPADASTAPADTDAADSTPATETSAAPAAAPAGVTRMSLRYKEACWTDIRDARGERLLYKTVPAGETRIVEGVAPFRVFLGNAQGVKIQVDGRPFDFSSSVRGVFARFTVDGKQAPQ
jgi:cytoskeleton protein RodZ